MKTRYIILTIILFIFITPKVNAAMCTKSEIIKIKEKVNNVKIESVLVNEDSGMFNIKITGLPEKVYITETTTEQNYSYSSNVDGVITIPRIGGGTYTFKFYYLQCDNQLLRTQSITVPYYNYYSKNKLCDNIPVEEVKECDEWYQGEVTKELLTQKINEYNEKLKQEQKANRFKNIINTIKDFMMNYLIYIVIALAIIIIVPVIIIRNKKRGELE